MIALLWSLDYAAAFAPVLGMGELHAGFAWELASLGVTFGLPLLLVVITAHGIGGHAALACGCHQTLPSGIRACCVRRVLVRGTPRPALRDDDRAAQHVLHLRSERPPAAPRTLGRSLAALDPTRPGWYRVVRS